MVSDRIFSWLSTIPIDARHFAVAAPDDNDQSLPRKRRRFEPPTPDPSDGAMSRPGSPTKRPIDSSNNDDLTPKPLRNKKAKSTPRSESSCSLPASQSQYYASTRSGQSSPLRHLNALEHDEHGLKPRELSTFHPQPPSLEALLDKIDGPAYANEILPSSSRTTFEMLDGDQYWDMKWARQGPRSDKHYSPHRETLGHVPSPDAVQKIVAKAAECSANGHPEVNWNIDVHSRVLEMAFEPGNGVAGLISSMGSSTASIIQEYHRTTSRSKKVDFCIYIEPTKDPSYTGIEADIERLSDTLACSVINHTDFYPLRSRPIALSIETKKPGDSWEKAKLQMGIWEWSHLTRINMFVLCKQISHSFRNSYRASSFKGTTGTLSSQLKKERGLFFGKGFRWGQP
ncbi:hypothetical protein FDECE_16789 [Fusarium decemcellulare]|nr:hypothetical protein FDECE_16789 [Fusarium decemcellulare]